MKYEVPEINISRFSQENIVTLSAVSKVKSALAEAGYIDGADGTTIIKTSLNDWVQG